MSATFLVPLDGSLLAERALLLAGRLGSAAAGRLALVRVIAGANHSPWCMI